MTWALANWRIVAVAALLLVLGVQTWRLDRCQTKFEEFRITTEALGRAQKAKNAADKEANEQLTQEVVDAKDKAIVDLSTRYAAARKRLHEHSRGGGVQGATETPSLASACEPADRPASGVGGHQAAAVAEVATNVAKLAAVEAALLDALERADRELVKYRALWDWSQKVK